MKICFPSSWDAEKSSFIVQFILNSSWSFWKMFKLNCSNSQKLWLLQLTLNHIELCSQGYARSSIYYQMSPHPRHVSIINYLIEFDGSQPTRFVLVVHVSSNSIQILSSGRAIFFLSDVVVYPPSGRFWISNKLKPIWHNRFGQSEMGNNVNQGSIKDQHESFCMKVFKVEFQGKLEPICWQSLKLLKDWRLTRFMKKDLCNLDNCGYVGFFK